MIRTEVRQTDLANDNRVYLKADILSKGLILVDLPGECHLLVEPFARILMIKAYGISIRRD